MKKARVIAMYLPQFHPIPENDEFWGPGFTEWTNVVQARPVFKGHHQPNLPANLGFYDLRLPETRAAQAKLAAEAGIEGFMYWHYWFGNGRMLLQRPFQEVLQSGSPDFPFCLGWANHDWTTKTWVKKGVLQSKQMIMEQLYPGEEDYVNHFNYVLPAFKDTRYIQVDGCPLFLIYDPYGSPEIKNFIKTWRKLAKQNGLKGIHFVGIKSGRLATEKDLFDMGFDAVNNRNMWEAETAVVGSVFKKRLHSLLTYAMGVGITKYKYKDIVRHLNSDANFEENIYPTILPGYDRTPRAGKQAVIYYDNTPEDFKQHVHDTLKYVENKDPEHKIILLKSWNEWGEGNYMEPDLRYGRAFLDALKEELGN